MQPTVVRTSKAPAKLPSVTIHDVKYTKRPRDLLGTKKKV